MTEGVIYFILGLIFGWFVGLFQAGLLHYSGEKHRETMHHTREIDEHAEGFDSEER